MNPTTTQATCPSGEILAAYARGELVPTALEGVAEHVSHCPRCTASLEEVDGAVGFLAGLRAGARSLPYLDEPGCARLEELALALRPEAGAGGTPPPVLEETVTPAHGAGGPGRGGVGGKPVSFGRYILLEKLGEGGMGVVYKARQEPVDRVVALKVIRAGPHAGEEELARFFNEGKAVARLRHPNVIQLYEFGEHDGQPYFSMEFAAGGSLKRRLADGPLPPHEAAGLVRTLALAIHAVHQEHIVHRDLKPANVLLMADGTPKVSDFGLAKLLDTDSAQTQSDAVLGTPAYMAPEQAAGRVRDLGPAVDVWALGVLLYECLTGQAPFRGRDREETLERVRSREPERPSRLRPGLSQDLEAVCLKCLEKAPADRYPSAEALADDLGRWLEGRPVKARLRRWYERCWRGVRAHPLLSAAAALLLVSAAAAPHALERMDADFPRKNAERLLAKGQPLVIEGHEGLPGPFRSVLGEAGLPKPNARERCGIVETMDFGLVELVRDPGWESYRFLVEMRHDDGIISQVGLYFGFQEDVVRGGIRQGSYYTFTFADKGPGAQIERDGDHKPVSRVVLLGSSFVEDGQHPYPPGGYIGKGKKFHPVSPVGWPGPWRTLLLEVRPAGVEAWWTGEDGTLELVERASAEEMKKCLEDQKFICRLPAEIPTTFSARSGLGLYVFNGRIAVRRIVLEPLSDGVHGSR